MCGAAPRGEAGWLVGGGTQQWRHSAVAALGYRRVGSVGHARLRESVMLNPLPSAATYRTFAERAGDTLLWAATFVVSEPGV